MKSRLASAICAMAVVCMFSGGSLPGQDQDSDSRSETVLPVEKPAAMGGRIKGDSAIDQARAAAQAAMQQYSDAESDQGKEDAKKAMSTALSDYFDADMQLREQEIRDIDERVKKLQAQLARLA